MMDELPQTVGKSPITIAESSRQIGHLTAAAEEAERTGSVDEAVTRWRAVLDHPCAAHQVDVQEILDEIHHLLRKGGRYEEAIGAKREAIAAGYRSQPDPEADVAECLLAAGRREEADRLYAELRARDPEDVWLNNSAAYSYGGVDDREALRWSLDGIELAIAGGDHDQVIGQLLDCAERSWSALGESVDQAVVDRVEAFQREWTRPPWKNPWPDFESPPVHPCRYCRWKPEVLQQPAGFGAVTASRGEVVSKSDTRTSGGAGRGLPISIAWFPAPEWREALQRWPDLLEDLPEDHLAYSHEIEARTKRLAEQLAGTAVHLSPLTVDGLVDFARDHDKDPGEAETRSMFAAEKLRVGEALRWPPGRNDRCWCGSGTKYKRCCGPVAPTVAA